MPDSPYDFKSGQSEVNDKVRRRGRDGLEGLGITLIENARLECQLVLRSGRHGL